VKDDSVEGPRDTQEGVEEEEAIPLKVVSDPTPEGGLSIGVDTEEIERQAQREADTQKQILFHLFVEFLGVLFQDDPLVEVVGDGTVPADVTHATELDHEPLRGRE
jgi:hypothetical protein